MLSVVVLTHNWPQALELCLRALAGQSEPAGEVIVSDDGSGPDTRAVVQRLAHNYPVPLRHLWQEHAGFRAARARNRGIAAARGDYIALLDGDMIPQPDFLADHRAMARPAAFLQGGRALLDANATARVLAGGSTAVHPWTRGLDRGSKALRWSWMARRRARPRKDLSTIMSCNQSYWRADLLAVNGFDEAMVGWGYEDTELAARCLHAGLIRYSLKYCAIAAHLDHPSRGRPGEASPNRIQFQRTLAERRVRCERGIADHMDELTVSPLPDLRDLAATG
jgi:glycosyltransferase involved in cell wall biosynthesis